MAKLNNSSILGELTSTSPAENLTTSAVSVPEGCVLKLTSYVVPWSNKDNLLPKEAKIYFNVIFLGIGLPLCFLVSLCCNTLNMVVFWKHGLKERINMLLFSLSLLDLMNVAAVYGYFSDMLHQFLTGTPGDVRPVEAVFFNNYLLGFIGAGPASHVVSSIIALERCLCITRPLLAKHLLSTRKTAVVLWFFLLLIIGGAFLDIMRYRVGCVFDATDNSVILQFLPREIEAFDGQMMFDIVGTVYGAVIPAFCCTCVTLGTLVIVIQMKKLTSWRETASSASDALTSRDLALTRMIVGTSVLFIVCIVPSVLARIPVILVPGLRMGGRYENLYAVMASMFYVTSVINSSFNFFVYFAFGSKFRQTVIELFPRVLCKKTGKEDTGKGH